MIIFGERERNFEYFPYTTKLCKIYLDKLVENSFLYTFISIKFLKFVKILLKYCVGFWEGGREGGRKGGVRERGRDRERRRESFANFI